MVIRLSTSHLLKVSQVVSNRHYVTIRRQFADGKWEVYLDIQCKTDGGETLLERDVPVRNSRGKPRQWKNLEDALGFVDQNISEYSALTVCFGKRELKEVRE
jgi:hypothetical protein